MLKIMVRSSLLAVVVSGVLASTALAVPKFYQISGGSVSGAFNDPGLVINYGLAPGLSTTSFTIDDGQPQQFGFFNIWTDETWVNNDDFAQIQISATLNFSDPLTGATVNGVTFGGSLLFGLSQWGQVQWNGPTTVTLGDRVFSLALSNESFNKGFLGLNEGEACGALVKATITQISSGNAVPEYGNTALLLGGAVAGLVLFLRKRRLG
jgi:hypothetical protein